jgi:hypothetical protein
MTRQPSFKKQAVQERRLAKLGKVSGSSFQPRANSIARPGSFSWCGHMSRLVALAGDLLKSGGI